MTENLAPQVFQGRGSSGFEIAFTGLLSTYIIQLPTEEPITEDIFILSVLLLITIALLRMMASQSDYRPASGIINPTQAIIEIISFATVLYGLKVAIDSAQVPVILIYLVVVVFPIFLIAIQEWLFGDFLIYYAALAYDFHLGFSRWEVDIEPWVSLRLEALDFLENMIEQFLLLSRAEIPLRLSKLVPYNSEISEYEYGGEVQQFAVAGGLVAGILSATFSLIYFFTGTTIIQTLIAIWVVLYLRILIRFWYRTYGLSDGINASLSTNLIQITISVLFVVVLFGWA